MKNRLLALVVATLSASCSSLVPSTLPANKLENPGWFDIGIGYGRVSDTRNTDNDDAEGLMASFKAYPLGRWYSEPKEEALQTGVTELDRFAAARILEVDEGNRAAFFAPGAAIIDPPLADAAEQVRKLLSNTEARIDPAAREALVRALRPEPLTRLERQHLESFATPADLAPKWFVMEERNRWYNRISVFYGRSISNFDSGGLDSEVNVIGLGFDVSPDLALQVGWAFYEVDEDGTGTIDSDSSLFIGASLNLFAFKSLLQAIAGAAGDS